MQIDRINILGVRISILNMSRAVRVLVDAVAGDARGYVCVTGVHGVIESRRDGRLRRIHNNSFLTVPDGMPLSWIGKLLGHREMGRVYGPDLMAAVCKESSIAAAGTGNSYSHFLYGATPETLDMLVARLREIYPTIRIAGTYAPPMWTGPEAPPLSPEEEQELRNMLDSNPPDFLWVGLSTPKQEKFMSLFSPAADGTAPSNDPLPCKLMLGVGAAFDILSGRSKDAPRWVKNAGMQWFYRLCQEPRRLWKRYITIVPCFIFLIMLQALRIKKYR